MTVKGNMTIFRGMGMLVILTSLRTTPWFYKMLQLEKQVGYMRLLYYFLKLYMNQQREREGGRVV